jgi:hypothetical protein
MRLEIASAKAIRYACMNFHYAKRLPIAPIGFSVFENKSFCGCILFNRGNVSIEKPYNLSKGSVIELIRIALNGNQSSTSKALSLSLRLLPNISPLTKLVVSYADQEQSHIGVVYQATNWYFEKEIVSVPKWICPKTQKVIHNRNVSGSGYGNAFGVRQKLYKPSELIKIYQKPKYKYIYPLDKSLIPMCKALAKPYPKKEQHASVAQGRAPANQAGDGGRPDPDAQTQQHGTT